MDKQITGYIEHPKVQQQHRHPQKSQLGPKKPIKAKKRQEKGQKKWSTYSFGQANNWPHWASKSATTAQASTKKPSDIDW